MQEGWLPLVRWGVLHLLHIGFIESNLNPQIEGDSAALARLP